MNAKLGVNCTKSQLPRPEGLEPDNIYTQIEGSVHIKRWEFEFREGKCMASTDCCCIVTRSIVNASSEEKQNRLFAKTAFIHKKHPTKQKAICLTAEFNCFLI